MTMDLAKRSLFKRCDKSQLRTALPWQVDENTFLDRCTRCTRCTDACDENIIVTGDGGFPSIDFKQGECTFCYQCASACPEPLFHEQSQAPWQQVAMFGEACLANKRIECRICGDSCDQQAIHFKLAIGVTASPVLKLDACTGCGACVAVCPTQAIAITSMQPVAKRAEP